MFLRKAALSQNTRRYNQRTSNPTSLQCYRSTSLFSSIILLSKSETGDDQTDMNFGACSTQKVQPRGSRCDVPVSSDRHHQTMSLCNLNYLQEKELAETRNSSITDSGTYTFLAGIQGPPSHGATVFVVRGFLNINILLLESDTSMRDNEDPEIALQVARLTPEVSCSSK